MHMADALISPAVGIAMWAGSAAISAYSIKKIKYDLDDKRIPLMGVMGAFVFSAQMINFSIPGTGSSGHIGGGLLLAILLGPNAGFLTMASILAIQALFFADGGLLAFGSNLFNLGVYTCFIAYPLIYKVLLNKKKLSTNIFPAALIASVLGLQLGSFSVVMETFFSGKIELPFTTFLMVMQPIHLAIGIIEGLITASVVTFIYKARPDIIYNMEHNKVRNRVSVRGILVGFAVIAVITGGFLSSFASSNPDGLEWSISKTAGKEEITANSSIHQVLTDLQDKMAFFPDYEFIAPQHDAENDEVYEGSGGNTPWSSISNRTSLPGLIGGIITIIIVCITGTIIRIFKRRSRIINGGV